jgi:hypothetical protein
METTNGKDGRIESGITPRKKRPRVVPVGVGEDVFLVPRKATKAVAYPLFGVQHAVIHVPRQSCWEKLKSWLAVELNVRKGTWADVWQLCIRRKPSFFQRCAAVTLARRSRSLPAGNVVFESLTDFVAVPDRELAYLSPRDQKRVQDSLRRAVLDFPDQHPLHLLQPLFVGKGKDRRLAALEDVRRIADQRQELLRQFCEKHGKDVSISKSEDHLEEARREYQQSYARRLRDARRRLTRLARRPPSLGLFAPRPTLSEVVAEELLPLIQLARRIGLSPSHPKSALARHLLDVWDPVIVIEEPRWRLSCYGDDVVVFRTAVHWDDGGVTTLG